ncbi:hypothetical protein [Sphingomonas oryzagri]|uniref:DUF4190 domain-containing protein n=1 Tax=Sphingomonas oryzagri TaxID=3042314 RepID=A0ABT6MZQ2_9SPHN|nr:hypothetical protein [Sphingomonas oryzagri]MDH7638536.1 hypothetical protein [Sphingomonas oryzagri]
MILGSGFATFALSLAMVAAFVLGGFGIRLIATGRDRRRGGLMLGVAAVLVINVLIWAWPMPVTGH